MPPKNFEKSKELFAEFCELVAQLRDPVTGCPWDLSQTHKSLAHYLVEEAYEASSAMQENSADKMCDELGDVLLQVVLNAQLGADAKTFMIDDVIRGIHEKMVRRHPHVFGSEHEKKQREISQIHKRWDEIKKTESGRDEESSLMIDKKAHKIFPATHQAAKIGKIARSVGFDWEQTDEVILKLSSELKEFQEEWEISPGVHNRERLYEEIGDIYFSLAQLCRHLDADPELLAYNGNKKFLKRFAAMEGLAASREKNIANMTKTELEALWIEIKKN